MSPPPRRQAPARPRRASAYRDYAAEGYGDYYEHPYAASQPYDAGPYDPQYDDEQYDDRPRGRLVTPVRVLLFLVFLGSGAASLYGLFVARSLPITVSSLAVLGVSSALLGLIAGASSIRLARDGAGGRAVLAALVGGFLVLGASGSLAAALVLGLLAAPT